MAEANKQMVKLRKVQALMTQLLQEWSTLQKDKKEEAITRMAERFVEKVAPEYLAQLAEQLANAAGALDGTNGDAVEEEAPDAGEPMEPVEEGAGEATEEDEATAAAAAESIVLFREVLQHALREVPRLPEAQWPQVWRENVQSPEEHMPAIHAVLEVGMQSPESEMDVVPKFVVQLLKTNTISLKPLEQAMEALARKLEELVQMNENAWHIHSHILTLLFPRTPSTTWGFMRNAWTWNTWWQMAERVLSAADRFRAFDILVLVLQQMQEKASAVIRAQPVWKDVGRTAKVRQTLCKWGEMDGPAILETLQAYGVQI